MLLGSIQEQAGRRIGITFVEDEAVGKYNEQADSPLFSKLPLELRDVIWQYATAPYEDFGAKFEETAYYCRPGHGARLRTETNLLLTCRRIFLEANALPMLQAEHAFYYYREAPDRRTKPWMAGLTEHNRLNFGHLIMYAQMYAIEPLNAHSGHLRNFFLDTKPVAGDFQPKVFHVIIRHTDFWNWENEAPLRLRDSWVQALLDTPDLRSTQTLILELETLDYKVDQLLPIVNHIKGFGSREYETHLVNGQPAKTRFVLSDRVKTYTWSGPANIDGRAWAPYSGKAHLNYHVEVLTWHLRFTDFPNAHKAHVAQLRRAERVQKPSPSNADGAIAARAGEHLVNSQTVPSARHLVQLRLTHPALTHQADRGDEGWLRNLRQLVANPQQQRLFRIRTRTQVPLLEWWRAIQLVSQVQAEISEAIRRGQLTGWNGEAVTEQYEAKWKEERSLLKFL